ncbi:MAG: glucokinase [Gammaproteobacteria bacterium]|nr:glucokinase [Gammaproteobacteria bacterium]
MHIIAADVGGTKTHFMFADTENPGNIIYEARYQSGEFDGFEPLLQTFLDESGAVHGQVDILTLALPGLVSETSATLTNLPWTIEKQFLKDSFGIKTVNFMNDFQASALGIGQLQEQDRILLNSGASGSYALKDNAIRVAVGAGTGLGVAWVRGGKFAAHAYDTEGGHIDFAPVDDTQIRLLQFLQQCYPHVSYERLLSGGGLVNLYDFCTGKRNSGIDAAWVNKQSQNDEAADRALSLFVQIYGAYIGNIALLFKPYGGIFITGGIAAKILNKMQSDEFLNAYLSKGRMSPLVEQVAVYLVTNESIGVLGAMSETLKMQRESK